MVTSIIFVSCTDTPTITEPAQTTQSDVKIFKQLSDFDKLQINTEGDDKLKLDLQEADGYKNSIKNLNKGNSPDNLASVECVSYPFRFSYNGYQTTYQDLSLSPQFYDYYWYGYYWAPVTITLPETAESASVVVYDYGYYYNYYGSVFAAYDENGNYLTSVSSNHYGWGTISLTAPVGTKIKSLVLYNKHYTNNYHYWYDLNVCYSSCDAPSASVNASQTEIWPPNNKEVDVTFSGILLNECEDGTYTLVDEYGEYSYSGTISNGTFDIPLTLKASRLGKDKDGRTYTFTVVTSNDSGSATESVDVIVPHDKR